MATMDATMELFGSAAAPSAPPIDGDDTYDAREREIEGGGGADAPGTLHLAVSRQKMYLYLCPCYVSIALDPLNSTLQTHIT
jgi:hypothetical protein